MGEPIYFSPKLEAYVKLQSLWFSLRISRQNSFTEKFVENYVALARELISEFFPAKVERGLLQDISQKILESEQSEFFLNLISELPEKSVLIASESEAEEMTEYHGLFNQIRALVKCANCGISEQSEKEFQKCS